MKKWSIALEGYFTFNEIQAETREDAVEIAWERKDNKGGYFKVKDIHSECTGDV